MAKSKTVVVTGLPELDRKFHQLETKIQKKVARQALRKAGKLVQQEARNNLVEQDAILTGQLKRGIKVRAKKRARSSVGILIATTERREESSRYPFGGAQLEFGHGSVRAYPFLRPAVFENEARIVDFVVQDIEQHILAIAAGRAYK